jgi:hypothetical protein
MILHVKNDDSEPDAHTLSVNIIDDIFQIGMSLTEVVNSTPDMETVQFVSKGNVGRPLYISIHLLRNINMAHRIMLRRVENVTGRSDARTSSVIDEITKVSTSRTEVVVNTLKIETVELVIKEIVQLPLILDVVVNHDVDCPVVIQELGEEVGDLVGKPDPHVEVANLSANPMSRRRRFAPTWKRIKRFVLCLCCCVRC